MRRLAVNVCLAVGVMLAGYAAGTPGTQWFAAAAGGALLGVFGWEVTR